ncbi:MAG: hypothetical protein ACP5C3_07035 [Methanomicrobiales archaeon]
MPHNKEIKTIQRQNIICQYDKDVIENIKKIRTHNRLVEPNEIANTGSLPLNMPFNVTCAANKMEIALEKPISL